MILWKVFNENISEFIYKDTIHFIFGNTYEVFSFLRINSLGVTPNCALNAFVK